MKNIWIALLLCSALPAKADRAADLDRLAARYNAIGQLEGSVLVARTPRTPLSASPR
jgi:hypothetical protein